MSNDKNPGQGRTQKEKNDKMNQRPTERRPQQDTATRRMSRDEENHGGFSPRR